MQMESNVLSSLALWWNVVMEGMWSAKVDPFESTCECRKRTAYTSWSKIFCHLADSSSHKSFALLTSITIFAMVIESDIADPHTTVPALQNHGCQDGRGA
jgi:hypothetical protein